MAHGTYPFCMFIGWVANTDYVYSGWLGRSISLFSLLARKCGSLSVKYSSNAYGWCPS